MLKPGSTKTLLSLTIVLPFDDLLTGRLLHTVACKDGVWTLKRTLTSNFCVTNLLFISGVFKYKRSCEIHQFVLDLPSG
ncbi:hypothetical protein FPV67DRAFT_1033639 [Lyophyllum atratum]|nr:hypothetical protein FPV67DRAFT_1033639 [Lyophyllum atratum]